MENLKRISVDQLAPGMFVVKLDRPWIATPFLFHKRRIKRPEEIETLKRSGVREVVIDLARGNTPSADDTFAPHSIEPETPNDPPAETQPVLERTGRVQLPSASQTLAARKVCAEAQAVMNEFFDLVSASHLSALPKLTRVFTGLLDRILDDRTSMLRHLYLGQIRRYDRTLSEHAVDACTLALIFAVELGLPAEDREDVGLGALLHDIGYLRLPRNLFRKRNRTTAQEQHLLNRHPSLGATILAETKDLRDGVRRIVAEHHERSNGSGFPDGLVGSQIALGSHLVGAVDTYLNLVAPPNGQTPLTPYDAIRRVFALGHNGEFPMDIVEVAVKSLGVYPIGSLVELDTGQQGVVVAVNPHQRTRPVLALVSDPPPKPGRPPLVLDLDDQGASTPPPAIVRCLDPQRHGVDVAMYLKACQNCTE